MPKHAPVPSRRSFLASAGKALAATSIAAAGFPAIVPATVFGRTAPSNRINVGAIGVGRISRAHDMPNILRYDTARMMAVCDLDAHRPRRGGTPLMLDVPVAPYRDEIGPEAPLGSDQGALQERRRGECHAVETDASAVCLVRPGLEAQTRSVLRTP